MDLDEMLKQGEAVAAEVPTSEVSQIIQSGPTTEKVVNETGEIYYLQESANGEKKVYLEDKYETSFAEDLKLLAEVQARVAAKKEQIKKFIEDNGLASFKTNILNIKYTSATTTTSIDTTRLKREMPELAAQYSKVSSRASSVSVDFIETPKLAENLIQL